MREKKSLAGRGPSSVLTQCEIGTAALPEVFRLRNILNVLPDLDR